NQRTILSAVDKQYGPLAVRQSTLFWSWSTNGNGISHFRVDRSGTGQPFVIGMPNRTTFVLGTTGLFIVDDTMVYLYDFNLGGPIWSGPHTGKSSYSIGSDGKGALYWLDQQG